MTHIVRTGKTALLYKLQLGVTVETVPTVGFNVESIQYRNVNFTVWDIPTGHNSRLIQPLLRHYSDDTTQGLLFVIDSNDKGRILVPRDELQRLLHESYMENVKVLVFGCKQDQPQALSVADVTDKLGLGAIMRQRQWFVQGCCATTGEGLHEGLDWLATALRHA